MKSYALETLIGVLLLASIVAVVSNYCLERELVIDGGSGWDCFHVDDGSDGGLSSSQAYASDESFFLEFDVVDNHSNPYAVLVLQPGDGFVGDWSWMDRIEVVCRVDGETPKSEHLNFHIRSVEDGYTTSDNPTSLKYNEVVLQPGGSFSTQRFELPDFVVPSWWIQRFGVEPRDRRPNFDQVRGIEFTTLARETGGLLEVKSVALKGHWIPMATLYQSLLGVWMISSLVVLLYRIWALRSELEAKRLSEKELLAINNALSIQSKELSEMAGQDELTGLNNRRGARTFILEAMTEFKRNGTEFTLIMFDVDRFKKLNDIHGHIQGDKVLCDIAMIARHRLRNCDFAIRWGGEEFLIICPATDSEQAEQLAESLRAEFEESELNYTASFGVCGSSGFDSFSEILNAVDQAMYYSKDQGRNRVSQYHDIFVPGMVAKSPLTPTLPALTNASDMSNINSEAF